MNFHRLLVESVIWRGLFFLTFFIISVLLPRSLEASGAGWIYYLTNWFTLLLMVVSLNLDSAVGYYAANKQIEPNKLATLALWWTLAVVVIVFVVITFYFGLLKGDDNITLQQYRFFSLTYVAGVLLMNFFSVLFYAKRNFFLPNFLLSLVNLIFIAVILLAEQLGLSGSDILDGYFWYTLIQGFVLAGSYFLKYGEVGQIGLPSRSSMRPLLRYASLALIANLVYFLVYRADYWFVRHSSASSADGVDLGNYIQVSKHGQMLLILPQIIASAVFPQTAAETDRQTVRDMVMRLSRLFLLFYLVVIVFVAVVGQWLFPFIYGATFDRMYWPTLLLLPGVWALSVMVLLAAYFSGKGDVKVNIYGGLLSVVLVLGGNYLLTLRYGMIAAAAISSLAYFCYFFFLLFRFRKDYDVQVSGFFIPQISDWQFMRQQIAKLLSR